MRYGIFPLYKGHLGKYEWNIRNMMTMELANKDGEGILSDSAIDDSDIIYVLYQKKDGTCLGYCALSFDIEKQLNANEGFYDRNFEGSNNVYIEQILVINKGKGLGRIFIDELRFTYDNIFVHVSTKNIRSLQFHLAQGFKIVDWYKSDNFHNFKNYNSVFLVLEGLKKESDSYRAFRGFYENSRFPDED